MISLTYPMREWLCVFVRFFFKYCFPWKHFFIFAAIACNVFIFLPFAFYTPHPPTTTTTTNQTVLLMQKLFFANELRHVWRDCNIYVVFLLFIHIYMTFWAAGQFLTPFCIMHCHVLLCTSILYLWPNQFCSHLSLYFSKYFNIFIKAVGYFAHDCKFFAQNIL